MYSGTTLRQLRTLDTWFGAHQKIDRLARSELAEVSGAKATKFPVIKHILRFEGADGPDAIKRKTPAQDEPWHYYDPYDTSDVQLLDIIDAHIEQLSAALREDNDDKASFEAAWLAHAVVDGLTPAHHYPYEKELIKLRGGEGVETRTSAKEKIVMPGDTVRKKMRNNWAMWGDRGLLATHIAFEIGVALVILPLRRSGLPKLTLTKAVRQQAPRDYFAAQALRVAELQLYEDFYKSAWTPRLAKQVRRELIPIIVETVAVVWYMALQKAETSK